MKVAVSITKVFEVENVSEQAMLSELRWRMEDTGEDNKEHISWYDLEPEREIWSYAIVRGG